MQPDGRVLGQKGVDLFGLVRGEVVEDDVNLAPAGLMSHHLAQEGHELGRGVPLGGFPYHRAGPDVEGGVERQGVVTVVLEPVALRPARGQGQHRIEPVEGLDGRLSSTQNTAASWDGLRYKPMMSAALRSKSGSSEAM
jgi:hypothetical protein